MKTDSKADEKINLGIHLKTIKGIAIDGQPNTINDADLTGKSSLERLEEFIDIDKSSNLAEVERELKETQKRVKGVFDVIGSEVCALKRYKPKKKAETSNDGEEDEENDGGDGFDLPDSYFTMDGGEVDACLS